MKQARPLLIQPSMKTMQIQIIMILDDGRTEIKTLTNIEAAMLFYSHQIKSNPDMEMTGGCDFVGRKKDILKLMHGSRDVIEKSFIQEVRSWPPEDSREMRCQCHPEKH